MTVSTRYLPLASVAGMLLIAGCGGGSGSAPAPEPSPPPPPPVAFDLPDGELGLVPTGDAPLEIAAGATVRRGNVEFMCAAGGEACVVKIMSAAGDDSTRTAAYEGTGGKVEALAAREDILPAPGNHGLTDPVTVSAGATATRGNVNIACHAGSMACTVVVEGGAVKYLATGGAPVLTAARGDVTAPDNHGVTGREMVSAGAAVRKGNVDIACPAGGASCTVVVEDGKVKYLTTGGVPVLTAALERLAVSDDHGLDTSGGAPITIAAGDKETRGNVDISCPGPASGAACVIHVINAAGVGGVGYEATGGMPVITRLGMDLALPTGNHGLTKGARIPVRAGASVRPEESNINITCPAGGRDCVVYVASDGGSAKYLPKGGAPTAAAAWDPFVDGERKPKAPAGHGLTSVEIAAGAPHYGPRGVHLECPAGAMCSIAVGDDGAVTYKATGGTPTVMTNEMILAANSGPNREMNSDGGHAVGLVTRIGTTVSSRGGLHDAVARKGAIMQSTVARPDEEPTVATTEEWTGGETPTLRMTLGREAFGSFKQTLPNPVQIHEKVAGERAPVHELSRTDWKWNGVVLRPEAEYRGENAGGTEVYAVIYSDIEKGTPGGEDQVQHESVSHPLTFGTPDDRHSDRVAFNLVGGELTFIARLSEKPAEGREPDTTQHNYQLTASFGDRTTFKHIEGIVTATRRQVQPGEGPPEDRLAPVNTNEKLVLQCRAGVGNQCEVKDDGTITGTWNVALEDITPVPPKKDNRYLTLGVWMSLPEIADGRFDVGAFANGSVSFGDRDALNALTGEAKYEGPATGVYARGVYARPTGSAAGREGNPPVASAQVGSFDATTKLTANFGDADDAPSMTGSVGAFKENGISLGDWSVQLDEAAPGDDAVLLTGSVTGEADGRILSGQWGAEFFKSGYNEADTAPDMHAHPGYAAGIFSASTRDENSPQDLNALHILGAFGASRVGSDPTPTD